jgi:phosphoribosylglycinamide formyltransferase-1
MTYTMGWFSTGRDTAARELLQMVYENISTGAIPGRIGYVFCSRRPGETLESDRFIELAKTLDIKVIFVSSSEFNPHLRLASTEIWRAKYHEEVMNRVQQYGAEVIVLAGYMLIVSPELIEDRASETGVMMHLVTEELDEGAPITYCTFPIRGGSFAPLWDDLENKLAKESMAHIIQEEGEENPLFMEIRRQGLRREVPLIIFTLKALAEGKLRVMEGKVINEKGEAIGSLPVNDEIEGYLRKMEPE